MTDREVVKLRQEFGMMFSSIAEIADVRTSVIYHQWLRATCHGRVAKRKPPEPDTPEAYYRRERFGRVIA